MDPSPEAAAGHGLLPCNKLPHAVVGGDHVGAGEGEQRSPAIQGGEHVSVQPGCYYSYANPNECPHCYPDPDGCRLFNYDADDDPRDLAYGDPYEYDDPYYWTDYWTDDYPNADGNIACGDAYCLVACLDGNRHAGTKRNADPFTDGTRATRNPAAECYANHHTQSSGH